MKNRSDIFILKDTVTATKTVKMTKLVPATKIKSEDGVIIPKEVLSMTVIQPSLPYKKEGDFARTSYFFIGVVIVLSLMILTKLTLSRIKKKSKQ